MKLINKQKVEEAAENCYPSLHQNWGHGSAFIKGVNFAEGELSNIAIDFVTFINNNYTYKDSIGAYVFKHNEHLKTLYTVEELFINFKVTNN